MLEITGGSVLAGKTFEPIALAAGPDGLLLDRGAAAGTRKLDASGLLVLPGMIDIHGDAFERQIMPRPGVLVDLAVALMETDRQLAANGVTTAYHGVTWSWEPGLRGAEMAARTIDAIEHMAPSFAVDTASICGMKPTTLMPKTAFLIGLRRAGSAVLPSTITWKAPSRIGIAPPR